MAKQPAGLLTGCLVLSAGLSINAEDAPMDFATVVPENRDWVLIPDGLGAAYAVVYGD